jgi:GT2 family glycosyltransferase
MEKLYSHFSYKMFSTPYFTNEGLEKIHHSPYNIMSDFPKNGEELCISILNYNRVELTIKLLSSIERNIVNFKGEVLIIDNNSEKNQLARLEKFIETSFLNIVLEKQNQNHGVGRARNIAANGTNKKWIMFIDSDMFFINNPLLKIQETIEKLGVYFLNLPIIDYDRESVFALGGALFMSDSNEGLIAGGGSVFNIHGKVPYKDIEFKHPFLSDFLFGGSAVLYREKFLEIGGFDYNMFIGFEDTDFSLRLYSKGMKIGNVPCFSVIHDHKPSTNKEDLTADKERYSSKVIQESGEAFFKKHNIKIYNQSTLDWLDEKQKELNTIKTTVSSRIELNQTHKIILIVDTRNWAFHNIANNIEKHLSHKFEVEFIFSEDYQGDNWIDLYYELYKKKPAIVYFFWRPSLFLFNSADVAVGLRDRFGVTQADLYNYFNTTILLTSVYDHLFLSEQYKTAHGKEYEFFVDNYTTSSELLNDIYSNEFPRKPYMVIQDGVDLDKFRRVENSRIQSSPKNDLIVGWVGNSGWGIAEDGIDHKGFRTIIKPVIDELQKEGVNIVLKYCDSTEPKTKIPHEKMVDFYNSIDAYICLSDIEGTPNTILEAMACGIAVITTNVGIVDEVLGREQRKYVLNSRDKSELKQKLMNLYSNKNKLNYLGEENLVRIQGWVWKNKTELFDIFFSNAIKKGARIKYQNIEVLQQSTEREDIKTEDDVVENRGQYYKIEPDHRVSELQLKSEELEKKLNVVQDWYNKEYESLPLIYKQFGHLIKVLQGKRSFKSLFKR